MRLPDKSELLKIYGETAHSSSRFTKLAENFTNHFGKTGYEFFSAPGRTEIIGNHTDHNGGFVIAAAINMDTIGAACPNNSSVIKIISEGYEDITVDINEISTHNAYSHTEALTAGIAEAVLKHGFNVSGFNACISSDVISSAGVSSSASFEMLICAVINHFFNNGTMTCTDYALAGQYAENVYWNKASGLMDQMSCSIGGMTLLDFSAEGKVSYEKLDFTFEKYGYSLFIINTGKGHADLSREYSDIPKEMKEAAAAVGVKRLCDSCLPDILKEIPSIDNDRAILRAIHFYEENNRVKSAYDAILHDNINLLLEQIKDSGTSSWELLQNCYVNTDTADQKIPLTLALIQLFLKEKGHGVSRIHGGGFAGVVMCITSVKDKDDFIKYISGYVGRDNIYPLKIRNAGAVHIKASCAD